MADPTPTPVVFTDPVLQKIVSWATAAEADLNAAIAQATATNNTVTLPAWTALLDFAKKVAATQTDLPLLHIATDVELLNEVSQALKPGSPLVNACAALAQYQSQSALQMVQTIVTGAAGIIKFAPIIP